jgi:hypothetical protein
MINSSAVAAAESTWHDKFPGSAREDDHHWLSSMVSIGPSQSGQARSELVAWGMGCFSRKSSH